MSDSARLLQNRIDSAIQGDPNLAGHTLHIEMRSGRIVIRGVVRSYYQKQIAQEVVRRVDGVGRIDNQLRVSTRLAGAVEA
jgi:osmotically-inducible protein OsmY